MASELRVAQVGDVPAIVALTRAGLETYRAFAPEGWEPRGEPASEIVERLEAPGAWGTVVAGVGTLVGFGAFEPAREEPRRGVVVPGLAHVWAIFVAPDRWGDGTATTVHDAVVGEIERRDYEEARLFTPAAHARALRFYEREGWARRGAPVAVPELGLDLVELRRPV